KSRKVAFDSEPQGADIFINGNRMGKTPCPLMLSNLHPVTVTFKKAGFEDKTYIIESKVGGGWVILDVLGGIIPVVIDAVTENWYNLETSEVKILLDQNQMGVIPASPVVMVPPQVTPATPGTPPTIAVKPMSEEQKK
ncbi:MAG: PEGA domain-containing protein, partial [Deltaproteobacteria bacterium]